MEEEELIFIYIDQLKLMILYNIFKIRKQNVDL